MHHICQYYFWDEIYILWNIYSHTHVLKSNISCIYFLSLLLSIICGAAFVAFFEFKPVKLTFPAGQKRDGVSNRGGVKVEGRKSEWKDCNCLFIIFKSYHKGQSTKMGMLSSGNGYGAKWMFAHQRGSLQVLRLSLYPPLFLSWLSAFPYVGALA